MSSGGTPRGVLLDIEGTTTPLDFVQRVLFPYAAERLPSFLAQHAGDPAVTAECRALRAAHAADRQAGLQPPPWPDGTSADADTGVLAAAVDYARWLTRHDRKLTALKTLQGLIWEQGYARAELHAPVFDDVPRALARWHAAGRQVAIFSSGSVLAQRLLFAHTDAGDLTRYLAAYFDTLTGPKTEPDSYAAIAAALGLPAETLLFVSDTPAEVAAARAAGLAAVRCERSADGAERVASGDVVASFDALP